MRALTIRVPDRKPPEWQAALRAMPPDADYCAECLCTKPQPDCHGTWLCVDTEWNGASSEEINLFCSWECLAAHVADILSLTSTEDELDAIGASIERVVEG